VIVVDASTVVSAALKIDSIPERALLKAERDDVLALSSAVEAEIVAVLNRPKFDRVLSSGRRDQMIGALRQAAVRFEPSVSVVDCRDPKDNKYLELALAAGANFIISGDDDLLVLDPWRGVRIVRPAAYLGAALDY
jgi:putative PIN family toxin of toxin-antitoxin system